MKLTVTWHRDESIDYVGKDVRRIEKAYRVVDGVD